jgi:hypothetical protein
MAKISERELASAFEHLLRANEVLTGLPSFSVVLSEVAVKQGVVDILATQNIPILKRGFLETCDRLCRSDSALRVYSTLSAYTPHLLHYIQRRTGLSVKTIRNALGMLVEEGCVTSPTDGRFIMAPWCTPPTE